MSGTQLQIDPEIRAEFIDESLDSLNQVTQELVSLEKSNKPSEKVGAIFRSVHSIKGSAPYFGLMNLAKLAHEIENILDSIRSESISIHKDLIDILLEGFDLLKDILDRSLNGKSELENQEMFQNYLSQLQRTLGDDKESIELLWNTIFSNPIITASKELHQQLLELAQLSANDSSLNLTKTIEDEPNELIELKALFQPEGTGRDMEIVTELMEIIEGLNQNPEANAIIDSSLNELTLLSNTIGINDTVTREAFLAHLDAIAKTAQWTDATQNQGASPSPTNPALSQDSSKESKTIRVSEKSIESFLEQIGELITLREMFSHFQLRIQNLDIDKEYSSEYRQLNGMFMDSSNKLLHSVMEVRKVPAANILNKSHRIVRDVAKVTQKEILVNITGDDLLIDKSILELLEMPLVHMVRNAADHGIELPDTRTQNGKSNTGTLDISLEESEDSLILIVKDDGQGIDLEKIQQKAIEQNIISIGQKLTHKQLIDLLFKSGVSTAQEVTDISGRGVGMDVVQQNIKRAGGVISIATTTGQGSEFRIEVPRNTGTQIINGFVVVIGAERFVIPVPYILKTFQYSQDMYTKIANHSEGIMYEGTVLPMVTLDSFLSSVKIDVKRSLEQSIIVILEYDSFRFAVNIDAVDSIMQLVLKDVEGAYNFEDAFSGAALLGDGSVSLVLDIEKIADLLNSNT